MQSNKRKVCNVLEKGTGSPGWFSKFVAHTLKEMPCYAYENGIFFFKINRGFFINGILCVG